MNLRWNVSLSRFEAEFADFQSDLAAVKAAGFKTDGPPEWIWHTSKAGPLTKLRLERPASGLTISPDARLQYTSLATVEENNARVKAELAGHTKALKKKLKVEVEQVTNAVHIPPKGYIDASDLLPYVSVCKPSNPSPNKSSAACIICGDPVWFFEKQDPPTCLWCEKIVLDNSVDVC
jgi:hypothetical protein